MENATARKWRIEIVEKGPSGTICYYEDLKVASFEWEFGGDNVIAIIHGGSEADDVAREAPMANLTSDLCRRVFEKRDKGKSEVDFCKRLMQYKYILVTKARGTAVSRDENERHAASSQLVCDRYCVVAVDI